jgi:hypothetical protein
MKEKNANLMLIALSLGFGHSFIISHSDFVVFQQGIHPAHGQWLISR